ncbi:MAG TPA: VOC family protein [Spirochaetia bacterium]|nr:VOC family protein [Spirochaetia bacterium]
MNINLVSLAIFALAASTAADSQQLFDRITMTLMAVSNMDQSKEFYTGKLGFKATTDYSQGGQRWVTVVPPGGGTTITLSTYFGNLKPGTMQLYLSTPDIQAAFKDLGRKGVLVNEIKNDLFGPGSGAKWFDLEDPDGNRWLIWQEPKR